MYSHMNLRISINMNMLANLTQNNIPAKGVSTYVNILSLLLQIEGFSMFECYPTSVAWLTD
jgi:hypothetical protein